MKRTKEKEIDMHRKWYLCLAVLCLAFTNSCTSEVVKYDPIKDGPIHVTSEDRTCYPSGRSLFMIHRADNHQSGYRAFHEFCKNCHKRGEDSKARYLTMESKSREGWDKVFNEKRVVCAKDGTWDFLTELQMWNLRDYLFTTAWGLEDPKDEWKAYECPEDWRSK